MKTETEIPFADEARVRATAWALHQLSPEETSAFESEMAADRDLAVYAGEMRQFAGLLASEFPETDESGQLPESRRDRVVVALGQGGTRSLHQGFLKRHWKSLSITTAAAAGIILTLQPDWINPKAKPYLTSEKLNRKAAEPLFTSTDELPFKAGSAPPYASRGSSDPMFDGDWDTGVGSAPEGPYREDRPNLAPPYDVLLASTSDGTLGQGVGGGVSSRSERVFSYLKTLSAAGDKLADATIREGAESYRANPASNFHEVTQAPLSTFPSTLILPAMPTCGGF